MTNVELYKRFWHAILRCLVAGIIFILGIPNLLSSLKYSGCDSNLGLPSKLFVTFF